MDYSNICGEFINELQGILNLSLPDVDRSIIDDIKADADEALHDILVKYKLIED